MFLHILQTPVQNKVDQFYHQIETGICISWNSIFETSKTWDNSSKTARKLGLSVGKVSFLLLIRLDTGCKHTS